MSILDLAILPYIGLLEQGSGVLLLLARDHPSCTTLCAFTDPAPQTSGSSFSATDRVHSMNPEGRLEQGSGFWSVLTPRDFELAILDTNVTGGLTVESGNGDDFGISVKVGDVRPASPVETGEFVFLSMVGGREGADVDSLRIPAADPTLMSVILVDLDTLETVLDVETVTDV